MSPKISKSFWCLVVVLTAMAAVGGFFTARVSVESALAVEKVAVADSGAPCKKGDPGCPFSDLQKAGTAFTGETGTARPPSKPLQSIIFEFVSFFLGIFGIYFLSMMIYSGFLYFSAGGNDDQVAKAKKTIRNAVLGFVIVAISYSVLILIFRTIFPQQKGIDFFGSDDDPVLQDVPAPERRGPEFQIPDQDGGFGIG